MYYSQLNLFDTVNGDGCRVSLFVSGCNFGCKGCWNPETWDFKNGTEFTKEIEDSIINTLNSNSFYSGLSLLGGDPLAKRNLDPVLQLVKRVKTECTSNNIWLWTGYYLGDIKDEKRLEILENVNVVVDGPYVQELRNLELRYRGSSNQTIHYLRY